MKKKLHNNDNEIRECHQKTIIYCLSDLKDINNLSIISHIAQEMWMQEKSQEPNQKFPGG